MYVQDNDFLYPWQANTSEIEDWWYARVLPYIKNKQVYVCPSDTRDEEQMAGFGYIIDTAKRWPLSYGYNGLMYHYTDADVSNYSNVVILADCNDIPCFAFEKVAPPGHSVITDNRWRIVTVSGVRLLRHNGGANLGFVDGHVKWYPAERIWNSDGDPDNFANGLTWQPQG
jgi:prepilin-type processing-associated H-X9-DG protein